MLCHRDKKPCSTDCAMFDILNGCLEVLKAKSTAELNAIYIKWDSEEFCDCEDAEDA